MRCYMDAKKKFPSSLKHARDALVSRKKTSQNYTACTQPGRREIRKSYQIEPYAVNLCREMVLLYPYVILLGQSAIYG